MLKARLVRVLPVLLIYLTGVAFGIVTFSQTTPAVRTATAPTLTPNCTALSVNIAGGSNNTGQGGFMFDCAGQPAIVASGSLSATPTFTFPNGLGQCTTGQTTECLTLGLSTTTCGAGVSVSVITSGQSAPLPKGSYVYCLIYENAPSTGASYGSFSVTWT
jgi:hypothetical protein